MTKKKKSLKLALQGGGAHGAFTWGVIDRLLEDDRIEIEALVGTSAGAMNAAVAAYGLGLGGPAKAKELLELFWRKSSEAGKKGPLQPSPIDKLFSIGNMDFSPMYHFFNSLSQVMSPYQLNPSNMNPLRDIIAEVVDFEALRASKTAARLFICATNVKNGRIRVFNRDEVTPDNANWGATARFTLRAPRPLHRFIAAKGSVTLDGVSLTVNTVADDLFSVLLIPHTLKVTTFGARAAGDRVHLEIDLMARYAARLAETA